MKHIFIVNKISGKGKGLESISLINDICQKRLLDYEIIITEYPMHAKHIAKRYRVEDNVCLYAVGGDGTILEVLNGLNDAVPFAIIPAGSGNDFYRLISDDINDFNKIINDTIDADIKQIDYGQTNKMKFLNCTSIGIDSDVNIDASYMIRNTFITKGPAYILSIIKNVIIPKAKELIIEYDGTKEEGKYLIACAMNGRYYGNGVKAAPNADIQDGYFDLILVKDQPIHIVYPCLIKYMQGKHINDQRFRIIKAKNIKITSKTPMSIQSDGENYRDNILEIQIKNRALNLKAPSYLKIII